MKPMVVFYVIFYKTTVSGDSVIPRAINLKQLLNGSTKTDFFCINNLNVFFVIVFLDSVKRLFNLKLNQNILIFIVISFFSVRPDEVVGVYYMFLG